jgi:hypothetical protein
MKTNPMLAASALAKVLESDPITASQIKEHISVIRLLQLLEITEGDLVKAMELTMPEKKKDC